MECHRIGFTKTIENYSFSEMGFEEVEVIGARSATALFYTSLGMEYELQETSVSSSFRAH